MHAAPPRQEYHVGERKQPDLRDVESLAERHPIVTTRVELLILVIQVSEVLQSKR